jgi:NAD+-dependent protein deacetylase SIR2
MGQEESTLIDDSVPPHTLSARTLDAVAEHIQSGKAKKITVLTGAGISTSAGSAFLLQVAPCDARG